MIFSVYLSWSPEINSTGTNSKPANNEYSLQQNYENPLRFSHILGGILRFFYAPAKYCVRFFMPVFNRVRPAPRWLEFVQSVQG
jgi:hypothetical protein